MLGYQYGYLGYPKEAVRELDKSKKLQPQNIGAIQLHNVFAAQAGVPVLPLPAMPSGPGVPNAPATPGTPATPNAPPPVPGAV